MKKKNIYKTYFIVFLFIFLILLPTWVTAQRNLSNSQEMVNDFAKEKLGYQEPAVPEVIIGRIIAYVLSFLGVVFFVLIVYGGWMWLTAAGNEEQITKAKSLIKHSVIGLAIVFAAYLVSYFVVSKIMESVVGS